MIIAVIEAAHEAEQFPVPIVADSRAAAHRAAAIFLANAHDIPAPDLDDDDAVVNWLADIYDEHDDSVHLYEAGDATRRDFVYIDAREGTS